MLMEYEEGDAMYYILDSILAGIKSNSKDVLVEVAELGIAMLENRHGSTMHDDYVPNRLSEITIQACHKFVEEFGNEKVGNSIACALLDKEVIPLHYGDSFMVAYSRDCHCVFLVTVNGHCKDKGKLVDKFSCLPVEFKDEIMDLLSKVDLNIDSEMRFAELTYDLGGKQCLLTIKEF